MTYKCRICKNENLLADEMRWSGRSMKPDKCMKCWNQYCQEYRVNNQAKFQEYREKGKTKLKNWKLLRNYGITIKQFNQQKELQLNGCAICKQEFKDDSQTHVDHNHETNEFRSLLCSRCNMVLGLLHEDEDLIWNILEYIKEHNSLHRRVV